MPKILSALEFELRKWGATSAVLYSELPIGKSGRPIQGWRVGDENAVVLAAVRDSQSICIPADFWDNPYCNLHAITQTVNSLRDIERWAGGAIANQMITGLMALPMPTQTWYLRDLGLRDDATLEDAEAAFVRLCKVHHPDVGGSRENFEQIKRAIETAREVMIP